MAPIVSTLIVLAAFVLSACAPTPSPVGGPTTLPGHPIFQSAERAFEKGAYREALDGYRAFLRETDTDADVDAALLRIGQIFRRSGRNEEALAVLARLDREFPASHRRPDAMLASLQILYESGRYRDVIALGGGFSDAAPEIGPSAPILTVVADAHAALGEALDAGKFYYRAWAAGDEQTREAAWAGLMRSAGQLGADDIQELIAVARDRDARAMLSYRLGMAFILDENYDDALDVLTTVVQQYPEHPNYRDAVEMVDTLVERSRFVPQTVGCILPLSGAYAVYGQRALNGIELALSRSYRVADENPVRLVIADNRSDLDASLQALEMMDRQKVGAILGPMALSEPVAAAAQARGIPIFVFSQREGVADIGSYVLRNFITPEMQVRSLVSFATGELGIRRFAILYPNENYGHRYMNLFWDQILDHGAVVKAVESYDPEGTDFAEPIQKLGGLFFALPDDLTGATIFGARGARSVLIGDSIDFKSGVFADPLELLSGLPLDREVIERLERRHRQDRWYPVVDFDALFIPDAPKKAGLIIPQLAYYDIRDVRLLGTNLWNSEALLQMSGDYMPDALLVDGFFADGTSEKVKKFVADCQRAFGRAPGFIEAVAYDSAMMVFETMRRTATDSRRELKTALLNMDAFEGVSGRTRFEPNGEAHKELMIIKVHERRFVQVPRHRAHTSTATLQ
jgi:ABC-type branched-subunit amino acid transport system substrate-binding protein